MFQLLYYQMKKRPIFLDYSEPKNTCTLCVFIEEKVHKDGDFKGMKSHDFHVMIQDILPLCM
jgi:hypothetical protein